jgi:Rho guanine nucleotide exchange factor 12
LLTPSDYPDLLDVGNVGGASDRKTLQLGLTIIKDTNGYGMKVSGDNPVYVESVKHGGAAQKAGLIAGDMILKVNGVDVKFSTHTQVVQLIKGENLESFNEISWTIINIS